MSALGSWTRFHWDDAILFRAAVFGAFHVELLRPFWLYERVSQRRWLSEFFCVEQSKRLHLTSFDKTFKDVVLEGMNDGLGLQQDEDKLNQGSS